MITSLNKNKKRHLSANKKSLIVMFSFIISFIAMTLLLASLHKREEPKNIEGMLVPPGFMVFVIYEDQSHGVTFLSSFSNQSRQSDVNNPSCLTREYKTTFLVPPDKIDEFEQSFLVSRQQESIENGGSLKIKQLNPQWQEITLILTGDRDYSFQQYETDGKIIKPKLFLDPGRGEGFYILGYSFLFAVIISIITSLKVKTYFTQKLN